MVGLKESPQSVRLDKFADDVMAPLTVQPDADEIIVEEVEPFRFAERDGILREMKCNSRQFPHTVKPTFAAGCMGDGAPGFLTCPDFDPAQSRSRHKAADLAASNKP